MLQCALHSFPAEARQQRGSWLQTHCFAFFCPLDEIVWLEIFKQEYT